MTIQDPHSYIDFSQSKIKHIDFHFIVDFESQLLKARASYTLDKESGENLYLDTSMLDIKSIVSGEREIKWELDKEDDLIGQRLHLKEMQGVTAFTIEYATSPQAQALQWTAPKQTAGKVHPFLYSQCQALHARSLFPCQDSPSVRFTYRADVEVPRPLVAVMGAQKIASSEKAASTQSTFEMQQPIPAYLFALAVGNLVFQEFGPRTGVYAEPEAVEAAAWEYAGNESMLTQAEKLLGPYLWDRYDLLIMPPSFPYGGMENPRLTFLSSAAIVGDRSYLSLIYHELAHAWTGNLVTNATWEHFWLNEGWTTYAQDRIMEVLESKENSQMVMANNVELLLQNIKDFGPENDVTKLRNNLQDLDPDVILSNIPYIKGALFLQRLEKSVGRNRFGPFLQKYIQKYQFRSLTTEEFLEFLEQELPDAAKDVDIQNWVFDPGIPSEGFDAPSARFDNTIKVLQAFKEGILPEKADLADWNRGQKIAFIMRMLESASREESQSIDHLFDLEKSKDAGILAVFYECAINSGYKEITARIEEYLGRVGRGLYIIPIYKAMIKQNWPKAEVRRIFEKVKSGYHPVIAKNIESILSEAAY